MTAVDVWAAAPESVRGLRVSEYDALVAGGLLDDEPVQLPSGWTWRNQAPMVAGDHSGPEPDLAAVRDEDYSGGHPRSAALVVEVALYEGGVVTSAGEPPVTLDVDAVLPAP